MRQPVPSSNPPVAKWHIPREGKYWLLITVTFWATGMFKGINLVTLLACLMAVIWGLNAWVVRRRLRHLRLRRWIDRPLFVNAPVAVTVEVDNSSPAFPPGLCLEDRGEHHALTWVVSGCPDPQPLRLREELRLPRRGWYKWEPLQASLGYPFGLVERRLTSGPADPILVFPQLGRLHLGRLRGILRQSGPSGGRSRQRPCPHPAALSEIHGVRAFRHGDSPRWIHWRTTARRGELMVREFEETPTDNLILVLDPWLPEGEESHEPAGDCAKLPTNGQLLEDAVSLTATICWEWCRQKGDQLVLGVADRSPLLLTGVTSRDFAELLLECLALQTGTATPDRAGLLDRLAATALLPGPILMVTTSASPFQHRLASRLRRPVVCLDVHTLPAFDFYERPTHHAS
jgi:uncharacterized protein (DUF58 family)